jgi:signal transduction histidine kinase/CheY-like chemotaxis protein
VVLLGFGVLYQFGEPDVIDPTAGRLALGLAALALAALTFLSRRVRRHALGLAYAFFALVSAWQIALAWANGLSPGSAFGVILVFVGCSAGIHRPGLLAAYSAVFVGAVAGAVAAVPAPAVPAGAFLATLAALAVLSTVVLWARDRDRRQLEEAREAALGAVRAKSEFLATMSHEVRTPMNGVIGMADVLASTPLSPHQRECLRTIRASGGALLALISNVLDLSKIEAGRVDLEAEPVRVRALADDALAAVAHEAAAKGLDIVCRVRPDVPREVVGDPARLRQVLLNLLSNAVKFTPSGHVVLDVGVRAPRRGWPAPAAELHVRVEDTGIGIEPARLDGLFESFAQGDASTTRRYGGVGLGLAISKRLVDLMGGRLWAESRPGHGSTFHVVVPLPVLAGPPASEPTGAALLLVDGHAASRRAVAELAAAEGLSVAAFPDGRAAEAWLDGGGRPDVAALDGRAEGAAGLARALAERVGCPVVRLGPAGGGAGRFDAVLATPVRADRFRETVVRLADAERAPAGPEPRPLASPSALVGLRVLLVEDLDVNRRVALGLLRSLGVAADVAENGAEAVRAVAEARYDVVLMDVQMPVMDGIEATRRIRAEHAADRQPRIVALTANALAGDAARCRRAGMDGYLAKPVQLDALRSALDGADPAANDPATGDGAAVDGAAGRFQTSGDGQATAAAPRPAPALTAAAVLAHLRALSEGDDGLVVEILDAYLRTDRDLIAELDGPPDQVAGAAHKLRAASGTLGADGLAAQAHALDRAARAGEDVEIEAAALRAALLDFRETVAQARARVAAGAERDPA